MVSPFWPGTLGPIGPDPFTTAERLKSAVKDLVLGLRLAAEDLDKADPIDGLELANKLADLEEMLAAGKSAILLASEAYDELPEERER